MAGPTLTEVLSRLHGAGRADTYGAALLDVAQDHLLWLLVELGLLDGSSSILKGGTSLRKCRLGNSGRFSTDLDFVAPDDATVLDVCEAIDGASVSGFRFSLLSTRGDGRHWLLQVTHPQLGQPDVVASVEFARRPLVLAPEVLGFVVVPVHRAYEIELPTLPVISTPEATAEKLARYRRVSLGRDVYDLAQFAGRPVDERLVRRLWALKAWGDVVDDGRGSGPLDPSDVLDTRVERDFAPESIGKLTQPAMSWFGSDACAAVSASSRISTKASCAGRSAIRATAPRSTTLSGQAASPEETTESLVMRMTREHSGDSDHLLRRDRPGCSVRSRTKQLRRRSVPDQDSCGACTAGCTGSLTV